MKMCGKCTAFIAGAAAMGGLICFAKKKSRLCGCGCSAAESNRSKVPWQSEMKETAKVVRDGMSDVKEDVYDGAIRAGQEVFKATQEAKNDFCRTADIAKKEAQKIMTDMKQDICGD